VANELVRRILSMNFPLGDFRRACADRDDKVTLRLARAGWGRLLRSATPWEDAAKTLCTTNASWGHTQRMCSGLCDVLGETTPSGVRAFPTPRAVLKAGRSVLESTVRVGYRSKALLDLAERADSGVLPWLTGSNGLPPEEELLKEVGSWRGFGPYAAHHTMVLLGYHRYLPIDREVAKYLASVPGLENRMGSAFEEWGEFRFTAYKLNRVARRLNWIGD